MQRTVHILIQGRVQGVGFRYWMADEAQSLNIKGWVQNLPDGAVEARFTGAPEAVRGMLQLCAAGPRGASVRQVDLLSEEPETFREFEIRRGRF